jgi:TatD DNase family protein
LAESVSQKPGFFEKPGFLGDRVIIDTHCHLDLRQFDADREAVIRRAAEAGVTRLINPAIDLDSCRRILALAEKHEGLYAAVGVHPNDCADFNAETVAALRDLAQHPKVVAIGEIGLDYYWEKVEHPQQIFALRSQLELAAERSLPVILHTRNSKDGGTACSIDLMYHISQWVSAIRSSQASSGIIGVWHAFSGNLEDAARAQELGLVLGIGGPATFLNARRLRELIPQLQPDRLMLETDAPYLAPHPYRGQRNEPAYLPLVAESLGLLFGVTADEIAARTTATAERCFTLE